MLWGYFYFPQLQLDVLNATEACTLPLIIVDQKVNKVVQLNTLAQAQGINSGMGLATAASLCHQLQVRPYQAYIEQQELHYVGECLYDLIADIAFDEPNGIFVRFGNMLKLYQGMEGLKHQLITRLNDFNLAYHYASAYSPYAAKVLAKSNIDEFELNATLIDQQLAQLPIEQAFESNKHHEQLSRLGIKTLAQLNRITTAELSKRFEQSFLIFYQQLLGKIPVKLTFYQPQPIFKQTLELLYEISNIDVLLKPLTKLIEKLEQFLVLRALASQRLDISCQYRNGEHVSWQIQSAEMCDRAKQWLALITLKLEKVRLSEPVINITVSCQKMTLKSVKTADLFNQQQRLMSPLELVSLLQAKLGEDRVKKPVLTAEHRPEQASQCAPISPTIDHATDKPLHIEQSTEPSLAKYVRPSYLLEKPLPLIDSISLFHGPERIETAWWQRSTVRDYFVARNQQGQWCWVFRNSQKQWFVHGYFG